MRKPPVQMGVIRRCDGKQGLNCGSTTISAFKPRMRQFESLVVQKSWTDQSTQIINTAFIKVLQRHRIEVSVDGKSCYYGNIFVERLWCTVKYEHPYTQAFNNLKKVRNSLTYWFDWYNQERFHQGLNNQIPDKVYYQKITNLQATWAWYHLMTKLNFLSGCSVPGSYFTLHHWLIRQKVHISRILQ